MQNVVTVRLIRYRFNNKNKENASVALNDYLELNGAFHWQSSSYVHRTKEESILQNILNTPIFLIK
jgi:hypothetical protein